MLSWSFLLSLSLANNSFTFVNESFSVAHNNSTGYLTPNEVVFLYDFAGVPKKTL